MTLLEFVTELSLPKKTIEQLEYERDASWKDDVFRDPCMHEWVGSRKNEAQIALRAREVLKEYEVKNYADYPTVILLARKILAEWEAAQNEK